MKKSIVHILLVCLLAYPTWASYTYEVCNYSPSDVLYNGESILFADEGGMDGLTLFDNSFADIKGTSVLAEGSGGIWHISLANASHLDMSGGQVNLLSMNNNATATLSGGLIQQIWSYQYVPSPHITIVYSGDLPTFSSTTRLLTGLWGNSDPFSIYLSGVPASSYGYSPAIENIQFELIPEPASLILLAVGGLLLKRR